MMFVLPGPSKGGAVIGDWSFATVTSAGKKLSMDTVEFGSWVDIVVAQGKPQMSWQTVVVNTGKLTTEGIARLEGGISKAQGNSEHAEVGVNTVERLNGGSKELFPPAIGVTSGKGELREVVP